jgi:hypothetical protein
VGSPDLTDVLAVASLLATFSEFPDSLDLNLQGVRAFEAMQLDRAGVERILAESSDEVASLRGALASCTAGPPGGLA